MKIGIDVRPLSRQRTGIGNYVHGLVRELLQATSEHEYFLYSNADITAELPEKGFVKRVDGMFRRVPGSLWLLGRIPRLTRIDELDIFWSTCTLLPRRIPKDVLKVITVYDLVWIRFPHTMSNYNFYLHKMLAESAIARADLILVISRTIRDELVRFLGVPEEKIRVVYPGISERYRPAERSKAAARISAKYGLPMRYLATVGIVHPRKNLGLLVRSLKILKDNRQLDCPLIVAGARGWKNSDLHGEIQKARLTERDITFLGYIDDEDLPDFYAGAQLFLFPTLYEGFGIPPVEAMACGTPVIASNAGSLPEVLGEAAIFELPTSPEGFAQAIVRVLADDAMRQDLVAKGIRRSLEFRYETSARRALEIFNEFGSVKRGWAGAAEELA